MNKISNLLRKSNLTPFEKVKMILHNDVNREKTGKSNLSESDIYFLTKGWDGDASEIKEYNRYIGIVRLESTMRMDAEMFLNRSELLLLRNQRVIDMFVTNASNLKNISDEFYGYNVSDNECVEFLINNDYSEYKNFLPLAKIFIFINKYVQPNKSYQTLREFEKIAKKVSDTFDIDITYKYVHYLDSYRQEVRALNLSINRLINIVDMDLCAEKNTNYRIDISEKIFAFDLDKKVEPLEIINEYKKEFKKLF